MFEEQPQILEPWDDRSPPCQSTVLLSGTSQTQHFLPSLTTLEVLTALFAVMVLGTVQAPEPYYEKNSAIQLHLASTMGSDFLN